MLMNRTNPRRTERVDIATSEVSNEPLPPSPMSRLPLLGLDPRLLGRSWVASALLHGDGFSEIIVEAEEDTFRHNTSFRNNDCPWFLCYDCAAVAVAALGQRHYTPNASRNIECHVGGKNFYWIDSMRGHFKLHLGTAFPCPACGKLLSRKTNRYRAVIFYIRERLNINERVSLELCCKRMLAVQRLP